MVAGRLEAVFCRYGCRLLEAYSLLALICLVFSSTWLDREKDEDEGIPSETEDDKRQLETKAKEMRGERTLIQSIALDENGGLIFCLFPLLRSVEAEGFRNYIFAGGEGTALQRHVGGLES